MPRIVHFEIPADDPTKVMSFYEKVFGWKFNNWSGGDMDYWPITTGDDAQPGINGGLMKRMHPGQPIVNTLDVASVDDAIKSITDAGGEIAVPKMAIPTVGWLAYFKDPEGNIFGVMQPDPNAA